VLLAVVGAFWLAGPAVTLALAFRRRLQAGRVTVVLPVADRTPRVLASVMLGLAAGAVLGVLAVPFQQAAFASAANVGTVGGLVLLFSRVLVDEVLLRLFLVTAMVWGLVRWHNVPSGVAAVYAVVAAAMVQVLIYLPGVNAIGFATTTQAAGYVAATVVAPALVFGLLFWKRGLGTAVLAHATALVALALIL
jgi:hypothetical protein